MKKLFLKFFVMASVCLAYTQLLYSNPVSLEQYGNLKEIIEDMKKGTDVDILTLVHKSMPYEVLICESGKFNSQNDTKKSFDKAVSALNASNYKIIEKRINWRKHTIVFINPSQDKIEKYVSGQYAFASDAENGLIHAESSLQTMGYVIVEQRINNDFKSFTIRYITTKNQSLHKRMFTFESKEFNFQSEAEESFYNAVPALNAAGYKIIEKRVNSNKYTIVFINPYTR